MILVWRLFRFFSTPLFTRTGFYKYYSPMLMTMPFSLSGRVYDFHLGTSWDFFQMQKKQASLILYHLAKGLVNVCAEIESGKFAPDTKFTGNVFYLKESTIKKFGFHSRKLNPFELFLFALNFIELCILFSISHRKLTMIPLTNVVIIYITAEELVDNKEKYLKVVDMFEGRKNKTATGARVEKSAMQEVA